MRIWELFFREELAITLKNSKNEKNIARVTIFFSKTEIATICAMHAQRRQTHLSDKTPFRWKKKNLKLRKMQRSLRLWSWHDTRWHLIVPRKLLFARSKGTTFFSKASWKSIEEVLLQPSSPPSLTSSFSLRCCPSHSAESHAPGIAWTPVALESFLSAHTRPLFHLEVSRIASLSLGKIMPERLILTL